MGEGKLIDLYGRSKPHGEERYGTIEELSELILYKRVISISEDKVELENGIHLTIELSESDCCAGGGGSFEFDKYDLPLEAVVTDFKVGEPVDVPNSDTRVSR